MQRAVSFWRISGVAAVAALALATMGAKKPAAVDPAVLALQKQALDSPLAMELVTSLTTEVGSRPAGSAGDARAVAWALDTMKRLGFENVRAEPVTVPHWVRGEEEGEILAPWPQPVVLTALGGSVGTPEEGIVAEVVRFTSVDALKAAPAEQVRGKIVFLDQPMQRARDGQGYGEAVVTRRDGARESSLKGAVATLIRSVATGAHRLPHTGTTFYGDVTPRLPAAALSVPDADLLARQVASGQPVRFRLRLTSRVLPDAQSANVIGEIRGSERPDEIVLLGAHLDSWDLATGAIDDGAGCAIVMAAAKLVAGLPQRPTRTLRVVLFANEEFGLSGGRAYAAAHADELAKHVLAMEADMGAGKAWRFSARVDAAAVPAMQKIAAELAPLGIEWSDGGAHGGADLMAIGDSGHVPMVDLQQDASLYFDHHHSADDTLDKIVPAELAQNVAAYATVAWRVAASSLDLGRPAPPADH